MDIFGRKKIKKLENENKIYKDLRKKDRLEKEESEKKLKKVSSDGLRKGSSEAAREMNRFKKK